MVAKGTTTKAKAADAKTPAAKSEAAALSTATPDVKAEAVAAAHQAVADAKERNDVRDAKAAEAADAQRVKAADDVAMDEAAKVKADETGGGVVALPDVPPHVPLSKEEQAALANARQVIAQAGDPDAPPITKEAQQIIDDANDLPPATQGLPVATPGASATNPALMRNDVDVMKTPPFGRGSRADLQG